MYDMYHGHGVPGAVLAWTLNTSILGDLIRGSDVLCSDTSPIVRIKAVY
jgi:hypothetical protein